MLPFVSAGQLAGFILSLLWVFAGFSHTEYDFTAEIPSKGSWIQQPLDSSAAVSITSPAWHSVITGCCQKVTSSQGVLSSWTSVCQPDKNRAPLNREINWEKAGQTLLSFTPPGQAVGVWLPGSFGRLQPLAAQAPAQLLWAEFKGRSWAAGTVPTSCCSTGAALQMGYSGSSFIHIYTHF